MTDDCDDPDEETPSNRTPPYADDVAGRVPPDGSLSLDEILDLLENDERRALLSYLWEIPEPTATVSELATHLAESPAVQADDEPDSDRVEARLHHRHLPKLAAADVLEFDSRSEMIRYRGDPELHEWLDYVRRKESPRE